MWADLIDRSVVEAIRAGRARISSPENWTKDTYRTERRIPLPGVLNRLRRRTRIVTAYCAIGSVDGKPDGAMSEVGSIPYRASEALYAYAMEIGVGSVVGFNDDPATTHADVLAFFDGAIAWAEAQLAEAPPALPPVDPDRLLPVLVLAEQVREESLVRP